LEENPGKPAAMFVLNNINLENVRFKTLKKFKRFKKLIGTFYPS
jgi:hypothetical protein